MRVALRYGRGTVSFDAPADLDISVIEPRDGTGVPHERRAVREALRAPVSAKPLVQWAAPGDTVGIAFSDNTRPVPNELLISTIIDELREIPGCRPVLFNATGTHRANSADELTEILGAGIAAHYPVFQNRAGEERAFVHAGTTRQGTTVRLLRRFMACDVKIATGFIEPHFFAGFSGGPKAIVPGLASGRTIFANHCAANMDSDRATWGITRGNPLWEEILEAASFAGPVFLLNVAMNRDRAVTGVFAGDLERAHARGCAFVKDHAMVLLGREFDIVITGNAGYPQDRNLYQSVKGMSAAAQIVKQGGAIIAAAECCDGIPEHGAYGGLLNGAAGPGELLTRLRRPETSVQDMWQAHKHALVCRRADVHLYSTTLSDKQIAAAFCTPCRDIRKTLLGLVERFGRDAAVCILPQGPLTIPYVAPGPD